MSESRTPCPVCNREVGDVHSDACPRSSTVMRELAGRAWAARRGTLRWGLGPLMVSLRGRKAKPTFNPGVPFVRPGKPWTAGGIPDAKREEAREFARDLGVTVE